MMTLSTCYPGPHMHMHMLLETETCHSHAQRTALAAVELHTITLPWPCLADVVAFSSVAIPSCAVGVLHLRCYSLLLLHRDRKLASSQ